MLSDACMPAHRWNLAYTCANDLYNWCPAEGAPLSPQHVRCST
jgi:hypothetical protein